MVARNATCRFSTRCSSAVNVLGIHESRRLVIRDPEISRNHLEIRLDAVSDQAFVIDISTNGTLVNGCGWNARFRARSGPATRSGSVTWQ